jgi:hypothetical protein
MKSIPFDEITCPSSPTLSDTEAHPAAILFQLLAAFGNAVGPAPHCMVDATRHGLNLFVVLVGESSKARKGTSWNQIRRLFAEVDRPWVTERVTTARLTPAPQAPPSSSAHPPATTPPTVSSKPSTRPPAASRPEIK